MIKVRSVNVETKSTVFFCEECEKIFGVPVEFLHNYTDFTLMGRENRIKTMRKFNSIHETCGQENIANDAQTQKASEVYN